MIVSILTPIYTPLNHFIYLLLYLHFYYNINSYAALCYKMHTHIRHLLWLCASVYLALVRRQVVVQRTSGYGEMSLMSPCQMAYRERQKAYE